MNNNEYNEYLASLKIGDKLVFTNSSNGFDALTIGVVKRITPTGRIVVQYGHADLTFMPHGYTTIVGYCNRYRIVPPYEKTIEDVLLFKEKKRRIQKIKAVVFHQLKDEIIDEIYDIIADKENYK